MGRVGTASRHRCNEIGLTALGQPRLSEGAQPYLNTPRVLLSSAPPALSLGFIYPVL
jgi:hypothetical protein